MSNSAKCLSELTEQRLVALELRSRHIHDALNQACAHHDFLQVAEQLDELQVRRAQGRIQWLQGELAGLQEAMERLQDGVYA
jgi:hypothetical protein